MSIRLFDNQKWFQPQKTYSLILLVLFMILILLLFYYFSKRPCILEWQGHNNCVLSVAFSPDGRLLASGSRGEIKIWRVIDGSLVWQVSDASMGWVHSVTFSPNGHLLATGGGGQTIRLWRAIDGRLMKELRGHRDRICSIAFSPDGQFLASGGWDDAVRLWRVSDGHLIQTLHKCMFFVNSVAFSPNGKFLAVGGLAQIGIWRIENSNLVRIKILNTMNYVNFVAFSSDGQLLASGNLAEIKLWRVPNLTLLKTLKANFRKIGELNANDIRFVEFLSNEHLISLTTKDSNVIELWRVSDGKFVKRLSLRSPLHQFLFWIESTGIPLTKVLRLKLPPQATCLAISPTASLLALGFNNGSIKICHISHKAQ